MKNTEIDPEEVVEKVGKVFNKSFNVDKNVPNEVAKPTQTVKPNNNKGVKILLVEDDSFLRDICYRKLFKEGFNIETASDGQEALKKIESFIPALVLLDIIMPVLGGFEVLKVLRASKNETVKNIPVIMLTNLGQENDVKKAMSLGASDYLIKAHFTTEEIVEKIKNILKIK